MLVVDMLTLKEPTPLLQPRPPLTRPQSPKYKTYDISNRHNAHERKKNLVFFPFQKEKEDEALLYGCFSGCGFVAVLGNVLLDQA